MRLRVQHTAMERAQALPLLGFHQRAPPACPASAAVQRVCREQRASKRWSALLTQTKSRIGHRCGMRKRLGEAHWAAFVRYAETEHKAQFFRAVAPASGELCCEGKLDGTPCPNGARIDLRHVLSTQCGAALPGLHRKHMLVNHSFLLDDEHFLAVGLRLGHDLGRVGVGVGVRARVGVRVRGGLGLGLGVGRTFFLTSSSTDISPTCIRDRG